MHRHLNLAVIQRILGLLLMLFSVTMLVPACVSLAYADGQADLFVDAFVILLAAGLLAWLPVRHRRGDLRLRDGFLVVALFWAVIGLAGAVPFFLADEPRMTVSQAVFEAVSGFTTTGATVLIGLDDLPRSILYYRHQTQWLGGIGIVVLAVALLPLLGIGGMQLLKAETTGPMKEPVKFDPKMLSMLHSRIAYGVFQKALPVSCMSLQAVAPRTTRKIEPLCASKSPLTETVSNPLLVSLALRSQAKIEPPA